MAENRIRVALACQGGGSHTAFTAGVLKRLLRATERIEILGLSGASGGAVNAAAAWSGLLEGDWRVACARLDGLWEDLAAVTPWDAWLDATLVTSARAANYLGVPNTLPHAVSRIGQQYLRQVLERHIPFARFPALVRREAPVLLLSAVNVVSGAFRVFRDAEVTVDAVLASAADPQYFGSVAVDGEWYWDGLFASNPPIAPLTRLPIDELWVVQINPRRRAGPPVSAADVLDRRNELMGNVALEQELQWVEEVNGVLRAEPVADEGRRVTTVRRIEMRRPLDRASKMERDPRFLAGLMAHGEEEAERFLAARSAAAV